MKILVFSDSHGKTYNMEKAIKMHKDTSDCVFFLGDGLRDVNTMKQVYGDRLFFTSVCGNCDSPLLALNGEPAVQMINLEGFRFMLTHGHLHSAKSTLDRLVYSARENGADAVIFGHTHNPENIYLPPINEADKPLYVFNPGSISKPNYGNPTYGIIDIRNGQIMFSHGEI